MNVIVAIAIDVLLLSVLALAVWLGARSGFIKALSGIVAYILGFAVAKIFTPLLLPLVIKIPMFENLARLICGKHSDELLSAEDASLVNEMVDSMISKMGNSADDILGALGLDNIGEAKLCDIISGIFANLFLFITLFLIVSLGISIAVFFLKKRLYKIKPFKKFDRRIGGIMGLFSGLFWTWLISVIFALINTPLAYAMPKWFDSTLPVMVTVFKSFNPFALFSIF